MGRSTVVDVTAQVNGNTRRLRLDSRVTLLDALRAVLDLTGTKKGCDQGACGTCTVLVDGKRVLACLTLAAQCDFSFENLAHQPQREPENTMSTENEITEIISRYTRAADRRDGAAMAALFETDAVSEIYLHGPAGADDREPLGKLTGAEQIEAAVTNAMAPHPPLGWSHHTTYDHLVTVNGEEASIETQFITFNVVGAKKPEGGWPTGTFGAQGTITPIESGYYRFRFRRTDGTWRISHQEIIHDIPYAF